MEDTILAVAGWNCLRSCTHSLMGSRYEASDIVMQLINSLVLKPQRLHFRGCYRYITFAGLSMQHLKQRASVTHITEEELTVVLNQAHSERWNELIVLGPNYELPSSPQYQPDYIKEATGIFQLRTFVEELAQRLVTLSWLSVLGLPGNRLGAEGAKSLASLQNLISLDVRGSQIGAKGAKSLASLQNLTSLDVSWSSIGDEGAKSLATLQKLTSLKVWGNQIGTEGAKGLASLQNLISLDVKRNQIGVEGAKSLAVLQKLTSFNVGSNKIGAEGAKSLAALQKLTSLEVSYNQISDEGAKSLAALQNLTSLNVDNNEIGAEGAKSLAALQNLTSLDVDNNEIGAEGAKSLAALQNLTSLHVNSNEIGAKGAKSLASMQNLTSLYVDSNDLGAEGVKSLALMQNLTSLDVSWNSIGDEGAKSLASMQNLTSLYVSWNSIGAKGAKSLASMQNLTALDVGGNQIDAKGAKSLASLQNLTSLKVWDNQIGAEGATSLALLQNLTSLDVDRNQIGYVGAKSLALLQNLTSLNVGGNQIGTEGAKSLAALQNLTSLNVSWNSIGAEGAKNILDSWSLRLSRTRFKRLDLQENKDLISILPQEVLSRPHRPEEILRAYLRFRDENKKPLNKCKLLVVGNEAVGKTSLLRFLIHKKPRNPMEEKTPGIAIQERIETHNWSPLKSDIRLNVWDFGGQEMMRETHRFFLTSRSLYLLVLEDRSQDDKHIYEWLKTIKNRAANSPILVVINKSDQGKEELRLDERTIQKQYPEVVGFLRTSCNYDDWAKDSIQKLRDKVVDIVEKDERLKHVRDPIPETWLTIKEQVYILAEEKRVLPVKEYEKLCEKCEKPVEDKKEQIILLRLLHDLGVIVAHGLEQGAFAATRGITLLDPNWLTDAIYKILNHPTVRNQQGEFDRKQLVDWLNGDISPERWHPGLIPRFIVEAHRNLTTRKSAVFAAKEQQADNKADNFSINGNNNNVIIESPNPHSDVKNTHTNQEKQQTKQWSWTSIFAAVALFLVSICSILLWRQVEEWRWITGAFLGILTIAFVVIQYINPDLFFRRW